MMSSNNLTDLTAKHQEFTAAEQLCFFNSNKVGFL